MLILCTIWTVQSPTNCLAWRNCILMWLFMSRFILLQIKEHNCQSTTVNSYSRRILPVNACHEQNDSQSQVWCVVEVMKWLLFYFYTNTRRRTLHSSRTLASQKWFRNFNFSQTARIQIKLHPTRISSGWFRSRTSFQIDETICLQLLAGV